MTGRRIAKLDPDRGYLLHLVVLLSPSLFLTARLQEGDEIQIFPLHGKAVIKDKSFLPSLRDAQEAGYIRLREIFSGSTTRGARTDVADSGKHRDWLTILLREHLGKFDVHDYQGWHADLYTNST